MNLVASAGESRLIHCQPRNQNYLMTAYGRNVGRIRRSRRIRQSCWDGHTKCTFSAVIIICCCADPAPRQRSYPPGRQPSGVCPAQREYPPHLSHNAPPPFHSDAGSSSKHQRIPAPAFRDRLIPVDPATDAPGRRRHPLTHRDRSHAASPVYPRRQ